MSQVEQCYWLVAAGGKTPRFICVEEFGLRWTDVEEKALRLYRREDAEAIAELCDDAWQVLARHAPPGAPASEEVENWKREALVMLNKLDLQEIGKVLGLKLGSEISSEVLPGIRRLQSRVTVLEEALARIVGMCGPSPSGRFRRLDKIFGEIYGIYSAARFPNESAVLTPAAPKEAEHEQ